MTFRLHLGRFWSVIVEAGGSGWAGHGWQNGLPPGHFRLLDHLAGGCMTTKDYAELDDFHALKLLVALADDAVDGRSGFRALFQSDPRAALAAIGVPEAQPDSGRSDGIWNSLRVERLAPPEVIRSSARRLLAEITQARASANPHTLDLLRG